ncbi:MAG: beta-lactamase family protein [Oscillospiraceae bacterium]|nr:beta-lactamase family protein [Oscillospiraceae bacterium]
MSCRDIQEKVQSLLDETVTSGRDMGMQLAVYRKGELIANAWAGVADTDTKEPVTEHTMFPSFSVTKGIAATLLHSLADKGALDYEQRIAEIWPGFAKHGKEDIRIRHALTHTSGLPQMPENITASALNDWDDMCGVMEDMKPLWAAGERLEYHALTYGWILGRVIELVSKKSFAEFFRQEILAPLGLIHMYIGIPEKVQANSSIAKVYEPGFDRKNMNTTGIISIPECCMPMCDWINRGDTLQACMPAVNGMFNALSLARHYAALLPDGVDGVRLLSEETVKKATEIAPINLSPDGAGGFGLGYYAGLYEQKTAFGAAGYGGSVAFADVEHRYSLALTKNLFRQDGAEVEIIRAVQKMLDVPRA